MKSRYLVITVLLLFLVGCSSVMMGKKHNPFPKVSLDLSKGNYEIVKANAIGRSWGFNLCLGLIDIAEPQYADAMKDLYKNAGIDPEGKAYALTNVIVQETDCNLLVLSMPKVTIRADIIEIK